MWKDPVKEKPEEGHLYHFFVQKEGYQDMLMGRFTEPNKFTEINTGDSHYVGETVLKFQLVVPYI